MGSNEIFVFIITLFFYVVIFDLIGFTPSIEGIILVGIINILFDMNQKNDENEQTN